MDAYTRLEREIDVLAKAQSEMEVRQGVQLARMESKLDNIFDSCPHREAIARASNNVGRMVAMEQKMETFRNDSMVRDKALEQSIRDLERAFDRSGVVGGVTGGGIVAAITGIIVGIGKAVGWW